MDFCTIVDCNRYQTNFQSLSLEGVLAIVFSLVFSVIIIYGIYMIIRAALDIIRSEGSEEQMEAGYSKIKGVFIGLLVIFIGIIGLIVILTVFGAGSIVNVNPTIPTY